MRIPMPEKEADMKITDVRQDIVATVSDGSMPVQASGSAKRLAQQLDSVGIFTTSGE